MALGLSNRVPWSSSTISHPVWHLENLPYKSKGTQRNRVAVQHAWNFGQVRGQTVPCDASIQVEDVSELSAEDASWFRSIVGMCLYLSRDRPDIMFTAKEVASRMSRPTLAGLQHLKKLMGYLKTTGELGVFWNVHSLHRASGRFPLQNSGCWNLTAMQIGPRTNNTGDLYHAVCTCWRVSISLVQQKRRESSRWVHVNLNFTALFPRWVMHFASSGVWSLSCRWRYTRSASPTLQVPDNFATGKDVERPGIFQGRYFGSKI